MTIKATLKLSSLLLTTVLLCTLTACGGGGETTPAPVPQLLTVTFGLNGSAATTVGAVELEVTLPDGFTLATDGSGQPTAATLTLAVSGVTTETNYTAATASVNGEVIVAIIKADGFAGNSTLLQLSCAYPAGAALPSAGDFLVNLTASDLNGATLPAISETVTVTQQDAP